MSDENYKFILNPTEPLPPSGHLPSSYNDLILEQRQRIFKQDLQKMFLPTGK